MLEARDRVGGRAIPYGAPDVTFDLGCGWLHSADENSFVTIAEHLNFEIDKTRPPWRELACTRRSRRRSGPNFSARSTRSTIAPRKPRKRPGEAAATAPPVFIWSPATAGTR